MPLKDILAAMPEDLKIKVGDNELDRAAVLAELDKEFTPLNTKITELTAAQQQAKEERDAAIAAAALRNDDRGGEHKEPVDTRAQLFDALKDLIGEKEGYDFSDPYSKLLLNRIDKIIEDKTGGVSNSVKSQFEELNKGLLGLIAMTLEQRMNADFARFKWPEGYDPQKAWSEAIKQGYVDPQTKMPNIARFNREVMAPVESKAAADKRYDEGVEAGKKLAAEEFRVRQTGRGRLGLVPRPGSGPMGGEKKGAGAAPRNLAEAIDNIQVTDADITANTGLRAG